ncbi:MAG: PilC/PilY family type IV pilus protein [Aquirhabdus sp.]
MLDGAGDMNSQGKFGLLIQGLQIFLATDDPKINKTTLGLGHYNNFNDPGGSGTTSDIIVPAAILGSVVNSTTTFGTKGQYVPNVQLYEPAITNPRSQRRLLWDYVVANKFARTPDGYAFDGNSTTNPAQGFAEAASYLLGTTTTGDANSGFASSVSASKNGSIYKTPLTPDSAKCAGVGIYFLTAGGFQAKDTTAAGSIFSKALSTSTTPATFTCPALSTPPFIDQGGSPWSCMGAFAQTLYGGTSPAATALGNVSIRAAFVGFGSNFSGLSDSAAKDICHVGSKLKGDACSPDSATNANPPSGYGNGGYYAVTDPLTVTASIKNFILTLGGDTVTPLVTGAASVPIDDLNPNGFQNYGYLRMIAPNPAQPALVLWKGDLKKYHLSTKTATTNGGALMSNGSTTVTVLNSLGQLNSTSTTGVSTTDDWNADTSLANGVPAGTDDGGYITKGGAYPKVPMPYAPVTNATTTPPTLDLTNQNKIRPLFTDLGTVTITTPSTSGTTSTTTGVTHDFSDTLSSIANCTAANYAAKTCPALTPVLPQKADMTLAVNLVDTIPQMFDSTNTTISNGSVLKNLSIVQKKKLINYLGFPLPIYGSDDLPQVAYRPDPTSTATPPCVVFSTPPAPDAPVCYFDPVPVPSKLTLPASTTLSMGGSVHAQPIQLTYSANTDLSNRVESVLYGSMEGALHMVNAKTGLEQMAFVPAEILENDIASRALQVDAQNKSSTTTSDLNTPTQGVDGPWVADPIYKITKTSTTSKLIASRMNVYGGMRMGGHSYYGLDLRDKTDDVVNPRLLFRIGSDVTGFDRMGRTFAKPVLANVRINNKIRRVMIVGGGYDMGYETPSFVPTASVPAKGNTVYMVDATTGELLWHPTTTDNSNLIHSVAARISAVDRDGDGLIDSIYFADLGGQVFRADFNNAASATSFAVRVTRLANLATNASGTAITNGTNPRFFEAPTVTVYDYNSTTFAVVTVASGNRSSPLDVLDTSQGGMALRSLPVNNVYGIIDRDLPNSKLMQSTYTPVTQDKDISTFQQNPQALSSSTSIPTVFFPTTGAGKDGWYRSLSSKIDGTDWADGTFRYPGGLKAYEEQIALTGKLYVPVYDPQGTGVSGSLCSARVVGETDLQTYCLPYGVCLNGGTAANAYQINTSTESKSGVQFTMTNGVNKNANLIGPGIRGIALGANGTTASGSNACSGFSLVGNLDGTGNWNCTRKLVQTLWYEKKPNRSKVQ